MVSVDVENEVNNAPDDESDSTNDSGPPSSSVPGRPVRPVASDGPSYDAFGARIRTAICRIAETSSTPSEVVATLTTFTRFLAPKLRKRGQEMFPVTIRPHALNPDRSLYSGGKYNLLCFHVGNTILKYYEVLNKKQASDDLIAMIETLEGIADKGINMYRRAGSDGKGYCLHPVGFVFPDELNQQKADEELDARQSGLSSKKVGE